MQHLLALKNYSKQQITQILDLASEIKSNKDAFSQSLKGKTLGMIFEKASTRTRVSFEVGMIQLGGSAVFLSSNDTQLGRGESVKDTARVLSRMLDIIMIRTYAQEGIEEFARFSRVPVINALTDSFHPTQVLADLLTMRELGKGDGHFAWIGDGNNMANSWLILAAIMGMKISIASPKGYEVSSQIVALAKDLGSKSGATLHLCNDPKEAVDGADVVSTDVWASMGQEAQSEERIKAFDGFCVDENLMQNAKDEAIFLHCLPAHKGEEVSEGVFESHADAIFLQSENRLHIQKAILLWLFRQNA